MADVSVPKAGTKASKPQPKTAPVAAPVAKVAAPVVPTAKPAKPVQLGVPAAKAVETPAPVAPIAPKPIAATPVAPTADVPPVAPAPAAASPAAVAPTAPAIITEPTTPTQTPSTEGKPAMNDTFTKVEETATNAVNDMSAKAGAFFNDANGRAKEAMAKGTKAVEELVEFSKGNFEALAASGRVAAKGAEEIAKYSAEYGRSTIEKANATARQFAAVKSPTEFFQLQGDIAKSTLDALVAEGSKFTESYLKLLGEVTQPISNRVAIAVDKVKTSVAA